MGEFKPTHNSVDLSEWLLRCVLGLAAVGAVGCAIVGASALIGAPSFLSIAALFPIFLGAFIVHGTAVLLVMLEGIKNGRLLGWMLKYVPRPLLLLSVLAAVFSVVLASQISDHQTSDGSFPPEFFVGFLTVFYVFGGSILVGLHTRPGTRDCRFDE